jgi:hypothetical protein
MTRFATLGAMKIPAVESRSIGDRIFDNEVIKVAETVDNFTERQFVGTWLP